MGGHGGLNILPQKRWNVYNRDNRLKVARDEAKAREEEAEAKGRHEQAERQYRHQLLLKRAGREQGGETATSTEDLLSSIFEWKEDELKAEHPEIEKEKQDELRKRGNQDTWTSDAKFDERFQLAYGLTKVQPWYSKVPDTGNEPSTSSQADQLAEAAQQPGGLVGKVPASPSKSESSEGGRRKSHKHKKHKHKKSHKSSSHKHKDKHDLSTSTKIRKSGKSIEELRQERLRREQAERVKARSVIANSVDISERMQAPGIYSSGYGYASAVKRPR